MPKSSKPDLTPVILGVGEASDPVGAPGYGALSPADLAARAARAAIEDAGAADDLAPRIDLIAAIRQFEVSHPAAIAPFGRADNVPRAVGERIGADPARAILEVVGGQGPQSLVTEMAHAIAAGEVEMALICGAEAISTVRHLTQRGETRDWAETVPGPLEDRGLGGALNSRELARLGARTPITLYALFETARRGRLGLSRDDYAAAMGALFAPFTEVAANNPHAMSRQIHEAAALATPSAGNRPLAEPYTRRVVARDQANQGAAVLMTSAALAQNLGASQDRLVYLHGGATLRERMVLERQDLSASPAAVLAVKQALTRAGARLEDLDLFDLYSCFPIAVFNLLDGLDLAPDDPRGLTMTGGLPYFGGAGNNYSMHAIAAMVRGLRRRPGALGLVSANGGFLSKTAVGVYSTAPAPWRPFDDAELQARIDAWPAPALDGAGIGRVETYTLDHTTEPPRAIVIARTQTDARILGASSDPALIEAMTRDDPLGAVVRIVADEDGLGRIDGFERLS